jgi:hypothetical protein
MRKHNHLVPRQAAQVAFPDPILNAQVASDERRALGAVVRVQGAAFAAQVAMSNANMLSRAADVAFRMSPMGEDVYRSILLAYGSVAIAEIQALGIQGGQR